MAIVLPRWRFETGVCKDSSIARDESHLSRWHPSYSAVYMKLVSTIADKLFRFPDPIPESQRVALTNRIFRVRISSGFLRSLLCLRFDGATAKRRKGWAKIRYLLVFIASAKEVNFTLVFVVLCVCQHTQKVVDERTCNFEKRQAFG